MKSGNAVGPDDFGDWQDARWVEEKCSGTNLQEGWCAELYQL